MYGRLTEILLHYRLASSLIVSAIVVVVSLGLVHLGADFSMRSFFGRSDPEVTYLDGYLARWGEDDQLVIVVDGGEEGLLTRARLEAVETVAARIEKVPGVKTVISVTRLPRPNRAMAGFFVPVPLVATIPRTDDADPRTVAWREALRADPAVVPNFLSADGRYGAILISLGVDISDLAQVRPVVHAVEAALAGPGADGLTFHVAGIPAIRADILDVVVHDQIFFVPIAGFAMGCLLLLMFRSRHGVLIPGIAAAVPAVMLLGVMGWCGEDFNLLNQSFLALVPAIAVANAIHLVSRYHEEGRRYVPDGGVLTPEQKRQAIVDATEHIGMACFLTTFTTIVGFLALLQTDLPVLRGYGVYSAIGVVISYFTLLTIPPLLLLWTRPGARRVEHGEEGLLGGVLSLAADVSTKRPWLPLIAAACVAVAAAWAGTWVRVDSKLTASFNEDHPTTIANHLLDDHLGGVLALEWDLVGPPGTFQRPDVLAALGRVEAAAEERAPVRAAIGPAALVRQASVLLGGPRAVPESPDAVASLFRALTQSGALQRFVDEDGAHARMLIRTVDVGAVEFLALGDDIQTVLSAEMGPLGVVGHQTGSSMVTYRGLARVTVDLRNALMTSFGVIGFVIAVLFRDVWLGVLSLIPNTLPQIFGYGVMGAFGWTLEPAPAVVYTIAVGVSVDSAIHIIARFNEEREAGMSVDDAVRAAIYSSGRAVMITELMLSFGFLVNVFSSSPANAAFGKLGTVIILLGPPSNLFVLPALLKLGVGGRVVGAKRAQA